MAAKHGVSRTRWTMGTHARRCCRRALTGVARLGRRFYGAKPATCLAFVTLLGTVGVAQAATVQVNVDASPKLCKRFLAQLRGDQVFKMTMGQLCRYDFVERHAGHPYGQLDWHPVPGDPVALTVKIFNANQPTPTNPRGLAALDRSRNEIRKYAQQQERHHALRVEMAPFKIQNPNIPGTGTAPTKGYVLRSRGSWCGMADKMDDNPPGSNAAGRVLIAFFTDRSVEHPVLDVGSDLFTKQFPSEIDGRDVVISIDANLLHDNITNKSGGGEYSAGIDHMGFMYNYNSDGQGQTLVVYPATTCSFTFFDNNEGK